MESAASQPTPRPQEARLTANFFEALFIKGLRVDGVLKDKLRDVGLDLANLQPSYPREMFDRCLETTVEHLYPTVPRPAAYRQLGGRFVEGFRHTLLGSVVMAVFPMLGPDRVLRRLAQSHGLAGDVGGTTLVPLEPNRYRFEYRGPTASGRPQHEFVAGIFEAMLTLTKVKPRVEGATVDGGFDLNIRW